MKVCVQEVLLLENVAPMTVVAGVPAREVKKLDQMKIGILDFSRRSKPHGAFLQAWSTFRILQIAGHEAEIINYKNMLHHVMESVWSLGRLKNPVFLYQSLTKQAAFKKAHRLFGLGLD